MIAPDVVVVGGGPVGLAAAIAVRQHGMQVLVAEPAYPPIDRPCGEGLMPEGVAALSRLGVPCDYGRALPFRGIRFIEAGRWAEGRFRDGDGLGIRRTVLHQRLIDRAAELGVAMRWGEPVRGLNLNGVEIGGRKVACRWVVGADGRGSFVRRWANFRPPRNARRRIGLRQHFRVAPWTDLVEVYWHDRGQAVVTPVARDEICVSLFTSEAGVRISDLIRRCPDLRRKMLDAQPSSRVKGAISGSSRMRSVVRGRVALVGDAGGAVDALTGEGLSLGFRSSIALADALARNHLEQYERAHRRISRSPELMARVMLLLGGRRALRRPALSALAAHPRLFTFALGVHTGTLPFMAAPLGAAAGLLWRRAVTGCSIAEEGHVTK